MLTEIYPGILGAILLICLCHSARLSAPLDTNSKLTTLDLEEQRPHDQRSARCLGSLKRLLGFASNEIVSGNPDDVRFFLYPNPLDKDFAEELKFGNISTLRQSHFHSGIQLKIIIHGFTKQYVSRSVQLIKDAYLTRMASNNGIDQNVILVDWEPLGNPKTKGELINYRLAVRNVPVVGRRVGEFIQFLLETGAVKSLRDVHIIGFSLGAHVAGNAGDALKELNAGQVPARVTGLDPAGPAFYDGLTFQHRALHKTDARFVDVIHTNMGGLGTLSSALGHVDFYPNGGGPIQYSCEVEQVQNRGCGDSWSSKLMISDPDVNSCSHNKAPEFFAMSILNPNMVACKCDGYRHFKSGRCPCPEAAIFGEYCDSKTKGRFYLDV